MPTATHDVIASTLISIPPLCKNCGGSEEDRLKFLDDAVQATKDLLCTEDLEEFIVDCSNCGTRIASAALA